MDGIAALYGDGQFHGHGTPIVILAAGYRTGVARKANLHLVKLSEVIMNWGVPRREVNPSSDMLYGLHHVLSVLRGDRGHSIPRGKAIVLTSINVELKARMMQRYTAYESNVLGTDYKMVLVALDRHGATVIMAAGNGGNDIPLSLVDDSFPHHLATQESPYVIVGSTNDKSQLSVFSSPGREDTPVAVYAQGGGVTSYDLVHGTTPWPGSGSSYAAPIVAGVLNPKDLLVFLDTAG